MDDSKTSLNADYNRLALLAYVILWDLEPAHRLERALRIVRRSVPWREGSGVRRRVLRRCIHTPRNAIYRPRGWLRMRPAETALDPGLAEAIERLSRDERVAYVLQRVERLTAEETAGELRRLHVSELDAVVRRAVHSVDAATELDSDAQRAAIIALDVGTLVVSPRWSPRRARIRVAALLAGVLAVVVAGVVLWLPAKKAPLEVNTRVGADLISLGIWPARGNRVHDHALLCRSRDAWEGVPESPNEDGVRYGSITLYGLGAVSHPRPTPGTLTVVFAGTVGAGRSVLLTDGGLYALYSEDTILGRSLTVENTSSSNKGGPLALSPPDSADGTRPAYLLPPGTDRAEVATSADARLAWRSVTARDGVITMPARRGAGCHRTLFRMSVLLDHGVRLTRVFTGLDNPLTMTRVSWYPPPGERSGKTSFDTGLVRDVICNDGSFPQRYTRSIAELWVEAFWHGALPEGHRQAAFASLVIYYGREQYDPLREPPIVDRETQTLLIDQAPGTPGTAHVVKRATDDGEGGLAEDNAYATASWHAPSGRWYLIAGGAPAITRVRAWGKHDKEAKGRTLILRGPKNHKAYEPDWGTSVDAETKSGKPGTPP